MNAEPDNKITYRGKNLVRGCGTTLIIICCGMVVLGLTVLADQLHGPRYLLYWSWCFLITLLAALVAIVDILLVRRAGRQTRQELLRQQFQIKD